MILADDSLGGGEGERCTQFVRGRSRMTIDRRIPTSLRRSTSDYCLIRKGGRRGGQLELEDSVHELVRLQGRLEM